MRAPITDKHLLEMMWERFPEIMKRGTEQPAQKCSYPYCGCNSKAWCKVERNEALDKKAENARELGLDYEPAQQEPVALKWQQAPVKTQWGDEMVVASVAIDKDHTVCLYCERDQTPKVDAMFAQRTWVGLTDEQIRRLLDDSDEGQESAELILGFARAIEAKLKEKNT